jgi:hypothetical protein
VSCVQCQRVHEEVCASLVCSTLQWLDRVLASTRSHGGTCVDDRRTLAHQNLVHAWDRTTCSACAPPWWVAAPLRQRWLRRVTRMRLRRSRCRCAQVPMQMCAGPGADVRRARGADVRSWREPHATEAFPMRTSYTGGTT